MFAKRIQIVNYGPIEQLDIRFPFEGECPKPVVLVGENGSGKSILLSHIVNGLISAKNLAFPKSPEVETGKVFKIRSPFYIRSSSECYFGRVDFEDGLSICEVVARRLRRDYQEVPAELDGEDAIAAWQQMESGANDRFISDFYRDNQSIIQDIFSKSCVLYFPPNRFEEPAWLNEENLKSQADYMNLMNIEGFTDRMVIDYSPLHANQNWLFDLIYDRVALEAQTVDIIINSGKSGPPLIRPAIMGYSGNAANIYDITLEVARRVMKGSQGTRFGIGRRQQRVVSLEGREGSIVPNIFQLSSGETSLLNLFLSILRDYDLCGAPFAEAKDVRGIVVVDEIDLHLHTVHQYEILPSLIRMFPRVQFILTTHSPLFVLGMKNTLGEDGFAVYRMPKGHQISPEEFSEFDNAYQALTATSKYSDDVRSAIEHSRKPVVYLEGITDVMYLQKATELLQRGSILDKVDLRDGGGDELRNTWSSVKNVPDDLVPGKVVVIRDCDYDKPCESKGNKHLIKIPQLTDHPIGRGIENLFDWATLERAISDKPAFIDIVSAHTVTERGECQSIPEKWVVNGDEKTNLCSWLCANGTAEDFKHFRIVLDLLAESLGLEEALVQVPVSDVADS